MSPTRALSTSTRPHPLHRGCSPGHDPDEERGRQAEEQSRHAKPAGDPPTPILDLIHTRIQLPHLIAQLTEQLLDLIGDDDPIHHTPPLDWLFPRVCIRGLKER